MQKPVHSGFQLVFPMKFSDTILWSLGKLFQPLTQPSSNKEGTKNSLPPSQRAPFPGTGGAITSQTLFPFAVSASHHHQEQLAQEGVKALISNHSSGPGPEGTWEPGQRVIKAGL